MRNGSYNIFSEEIDTNGEQRLLRYNRDNRLQKASGKVRQMHDEEFVKKHGIFKTLILNKGFAAVFLIIVIIGAINFIMFFINQNKVIGSINGIPVQMVCLPHGDELLVDIIFFPVDKVEYDFEVIVLLGAHNYLGAIIEQIELDDVYIGQKLHIGGKLKIKNMQKIRADIIIGNKFLILEKDIYRN